MKKRLQILTLITALGFSGAASATLVGRGGGLIYDTDLNITWLANANLGDTVSFGVSGISSSGGMLWSVANDYIAAMNAYDGGNGYLGFNIWRLPDMDRNDDHAVVKCNLGEAGCSDNELGHLFWEEGITNSTPSPFGNIEGQQYWSGTTTYGYVNSLIGWVITNPEQTWILNFYATNGANYTLSKTGAVGAYVWPVISGDVAAVPIPAAVWLFGSGLLGLIGVARRRMVSTHETVSIP